MTMLSAERVEQIYDWLEERIEEWKVRRYEDLSLIPAILEDAEDNLKSRSMLTKNEAKTVGTLIMEELDERLTNLDRYKGHMNSVQYIDELSIYADAWYHFCRPGTYSISI